MRPVSTCDFCGADAAGAFEVLPPELEPTEAEQRRVVLCGDCKGRLTDVLEPLLARLDAGQNTPADERTPTEITIGADEDGNEDEPEADGTDDSSRDGAASDDHQESVEGEPDDHQESVEGEPDDPHDGGGTRPRAYAKVMRLLRNREFPMERAAVENLAAGAYDLEAHEAAAIVDHAVDEGELLEDGGTLRRP